MYIRALHARALKYRLASTRLFSVYSYNKNVCAYMRTHTQFSMYVSVAVNASREASVNTHKHVLQHTGQAFPDSKTAASAVRTRPCYAHKFMAVFYTMSRFFMLVASIISIFKCQLCTWCTILRVMIGMFVFVPSFLLSWPYHSWCTLRAISSTPEPCIKPLVNAHTPLQTSDDTALFHCQLDILMYLH